jgi:GNAT superfamily N-acetyltransferase
MLALHFCSVTTRHRVLTDFCMMTPSSGLCLGASFEHAVRLEDGRNVRLRWIRPADADLVREGFARLSLESRLMRFFTPLHALSDDAVRYLTEVDGLNHAALIAVSTPGEGPRAEEKGYGVARFIRSATDPSSAEVAVTVTDDTQGRGLGRRLVETLAVAARERGIETFEMTVLGSNWRIRDFLHRLHAEHRRRDGEVLEFSVGTAAIVAQTAAGALPPCRKSEVPDYSEALPTNQQAKV